MIEWLRPESDFPDTRRALGRDSDAPGLLAAGGELSPERLEQAYSRGIFPWFGLEQPLMWWSPDPRMVLPVADFKLTRSLRKTLLKFRGSSTCEVRIDHSLPRVLAHCADMPRPGQDGTWIVPEMQTAYLNWARLHDTVHSFETWIDGELAGGLYGVNIGRMFFGESMFSLQTDASKIALAALVCFCRRHRMAVIDCQQETRHLKSMGARPWPRHRFEAHLARVTGLPRPQEWTYHDAFWDELMPPSPPPADSPA